MSLDFFTSGCKHSSSKKTFGLCDDIDASGSTSSPAYIDEQNGSNWIATIDNHHKDKIDFYAIDNCLVFPLTAGKPSKRCDGMLISGNKIAFVELKSRNEDGAKWVADAEEQIRSAITFFKTTDDADKYKIKRAYIVNNMRPQSRTSQAQRMERFLDETEYRLFVKARIALYSEEG